MKGNLRLAIGAWLLALGSLAVAQPVNPPLRQLGEGVFQLGTVRLDKTRRTVEFPAELNMNDGLIEYLLVDARGKTYESLLKTDAQPYDVQLAMLLLGAKGAPPTPALLNAPSVPFHINAPPGATNALPAIGGDPIFIDLTWQSGGKEKRARAEDWILDLTTKTNASRGNWTYNGSRVLRGAFIAQRDGQIVALIDDIDAMVNNPRPAHDNDQVWQIDSNALPPLHTPVEVTFTLQP
jgi:hypothetical protein